MKTKGKSKILTLISVLCIAAILASFGTIFASADAGYIGPKPTYAGIVDDWGIVIYPDFDTIESMVCVAAYFGSDTQLVIPTEIGGYTINCVGDYWGWGNSGFDCYQGDVTFNEEFYSFDGECVNEAITEVVISEGIQYISDYAFSGYENLKSISIPDSVMRIGVSAFNRTGYYNTESNWRDGVLYMDKYLLAARDDEISDNYTVLLGTKLIAGGAFENCKNLTSISIPDSVISIGPFAFDSCSNLTNITFPNSVMDIGSFAFYNCDSLTSITIPDSVTRIDLRAFCGCKHLTSITVLNRGVMSISYEAFAHSPLTTIYGYIGSSAESYAKEYGYTFIPIQDFTDSDSGISIVVTEADTLPENVALNVETVEMTDNKVVYNITLVAGGKEVQPNGTVTVKIPVPETMDGTTVKVYREETDSTLTDMHAVLEDGYMVFATDHFSTYILEGEEAEAPTNPTEPSEPADPTDPTAPTDPQSPDEPSTPADTTQQGQDGTTQGKADSTDANIPKTGSASNTYAWVCALMLTIAAFGAFGLVKIRRKKHALS